MTGYEWGWHVRRRTSSRLRVVLLALALGGFLLPLGWTVLASLGIQPNDTAVPPRWEGTLTLANYTEEVQVFESSFWRTLFVTGAVAATATILTVVISFLAAYSLSRARRRATRWVVQSFIVLASLPVMAYIIPLAVLVRRLHLSDTFLGVTLAQTAILAPLATFVLYGYLAQAPAELDQAARLEGAGLYDLIARIALPMTLSGVIATAIIIFVLNWNVLLVPLLLAGVEVRTLPVALIDFYTMERELEWGTAAAALVTSVAPMLLLFLLTHRALERFTLEPIGAGD